jgi:hypothetical protein
VSPEDFSRLSPVLLDWISETLAAYSGATRSVAQVGFRRLPDFFSRRLLETAKVVAADPLPLPPPGELGLEQFSSFLSPATTIGITYLDTFFVRPDHSQDEALHFHELVHVVQWRRLGPELFLQVYADGLEKSGYRESFLERMAFDLEERFRSAKEPFAAEHEIDEMLRGARFHN